ncbi:hypothetical protein BJX64DRAFT_289578 [Aspergillus heterothallicus]
MEGVGAAASIIAVIELSGKVATALFQCLTQAKNAKPEIERLRDEVERLSAILKSAKRLLDGPNGDDLKTSHGLGQGLDICYSELTSLEGKLRKKLDSTSTRAMSKFGIRGLKWPLESKDVDRLIANLERQRDALTTALAIDQAYLPIVHDALFDSQANEHEPRCHPETRHDLLQEIYDWVDDPTGKSVFWLQGMAGTGKSTISRTVAQHFVEREDLVATFFFKRGEGDRGNTSRFISTIASQLVSKDSTIAASVKRAIDSDHAITSKPSGEQFEKLILTPLDDLKVHLIKPKTVVLVVDALDECGREEDIKMLLYQISRGAELTSVRWRAFLTGRPELPVRLGIDLIQEKVEHKILDLIPDAVIEADLVAFLETEFEKIKHDFNRLFPSDMHLAQDWPGPTIIRTLSHMAIPLFIFAATVCRFVGDRTWADPKAQLDKVLQYQGAETEQSVFDKLNATYLPVLNSMSVTTKAGQQRLHHEFRTVVGSIILLAEPLSAHSLSCLLGISRSIIDRRLMSLHSVIRVPKSPDLPIKPLHLSFRDFLIDPDKRDSYPFWIDERVAHERLATGCLDLLCSYDHLKKDICHLGSPGILRSEIPATVVNLSIPVEVQYACRHWVYHLRQSGTPLTDGHRVRDFLTQHFLHWLEALSLLGRLSESIAMIQTLQGLVRESNQVVSQFLHNALRFVLAFKSVIESSPLQVYSSALIFAPKRCLVKRTFQHHIPGYVNGDIGEPEWTNFRQILDDANSGFTYLVFSPDGMTIAASCYEDGTILLWDSTTGEQRLRIQTEDCPVSLKFSPDNRTVAVILQSRMPTFGVASQPSRRTTLTCYDATTGKIVFHLEEPSVAVCFSPDSEKIASVSHHRVRIWRQSTGEEELSCIMCDIKPKYIAFSPDGKKILVTGSNLEEFPKTRAVVSLLDLVSGEQLGMDNARLTQTYLFPPTLSSDGTTRGWLDASKTIYIQDTSTGEIRQELRNSDSVDTLLFSSDGGLLFCRYSEGFGIWNTTTGQYIASYYGVHEFIVAISKNSQRVALALPQMGVELWDILMHDETSECHSDTASIPSLPDIVDPSSDIDESDDPQSFNCLIFSPDGRTVASASAGPGIHIWDAETGKTIHVLPQTEVTRNIVFSKDGQLLVSLAGEVITVRDAVSAKMKKQLEYDDRIQFFILAPDNSIVAFVSNHVVCLWLLAKDQDVQVLPHENDVDDMAFSPDGRLLATAFSDVINLWDIATGKRTQSLRNARLSTSETTKDFTVRSMTFSLNGNTLAATVKVQEYIDYLLIRKWNFVAVWNIATGVCRRVSDDEGATTDKIALSSDGGIVAAATVPRGRIVQFWDGRPHREMELTCDIRCISFSADDQYLETDRGLLNVKTMKPHTSGFMSHDWVWKGEDRILCLPPVHRNFRIACHGSTFVLGYSPNQIMFLRLDSL